MTSRESTTLRTVLQKRAIRTLGFGIGFGLTMAAGVAIYSDAFDGITDMGAQTSEVPASVVDHPAAPSRVERLIEAHHCWTGEGPAGVIPGHAVVTRDGRTKLVAADVGFGIWLDGERGTLHAFCR